VHRDLVQNLDSGIDAVLCADPVAARIVQRAERLFAVLDATKIGQGEPERFQAFGETAWTDDEQGNQRQKNDRNNFRHGVDSAYAWEWGSSGTGALAGVSGVTTILASGSALVSGAGGVVELALLSVGVGGMILGGLFVEDG